MHSIKVSVADLRDSPDHIPLNDYSHQDLRLSQCNEGDQVQILKREGEWSFVSAWGQLQFKERRWQAYQGWLHNTEIEATSHTSHFSFTKKIERESLLSYGEQFLGLPYLWGGCSFPVPGKIASVDCSGLMHQLFKKQGRLIPRDAHDQYLAAMPIRTPLPGDLLFLRLPHKKRITHVILLFDQEHFLESPESGKTVRLLRKGSEIWQERGLFRIFDRPNPYIGSFGRF